MLQGVAGGWLAELRAVTNSTRKARNRACTGARAIMRDAWPRSLLLVVIAGVAGATVPACRGGESSRTSTSSRSSETTTASTTSVIVPLAAKSGSSLSGRAVLTETPQGVRVVVEVTGVPPGLHATHVHEKPDCSAPDAKSAGDHYAPDGHPHGMPPAQPRHLGDFGNMVVDSEGKGFLDFTAERANLRPNDPRSFVGRAIVVHARADDGSQPSGNAGDRIGCGEIRN